MTVTASGDVMVESGSLIDVTGGYKAIRDSGRICTTNDIAPGEASLKSKQ